MLIQDNLNIIFDEGPFTRAYLALINQEKIKIQKKIILLNNNYFKNFFLRKNFMNSNTLSLKFLTDKRVYTFINQIEVFFKFDLGFCKKMYDFDNLFNDNSEIIYVKSESINSLELFNLLKDFDKDFLFLSTTKQILKKPLETNHRFIHIHPGYLPFVKGMDCSLWAILKKNKLGVSSFFIDYDIDSGKIIDREEYDLPKFLLEEEKHFSNYDKYCMWYSFFDPLLRAAHLKKILKFKTLNNAIFKIETPLLETGEYFKKMDEKSLDYVFKKIFYSNK
jgi:hypothetical protein